MKQKTWALWLVAAICFTFVGITRFIVESYIVGIPFILLGGAYFILSIVNYKGRNKSNENTLCDTALEKLDNELRSLLSEGKRIKAIKKYRMVTGLGLKEAQEYVDSLRAEK